MQKAAVHYACDRLDDFRAVHSGTSRSSLRQSVDVWLQEGLGIEPDTWFELRERLRPEFDDHLGAVMIGIILAHYMMEYDQGDE